MKKLIILTSSLIFSIGIAGDFGGYSIFGYDNDAFDMKRVYLKYSNNISDDLQFKLTYDVGRDDNDNKLSSYLKHAYINYNQSFGLISLGVIGTNSYEAQEKTWGYRFIEKSSLGGTIVILFLWLILIFAVNAKPAYITDFLSNFFNVMDLRSMSVFIKENTNSTITHDYFKGSLLTESINFDKNL